MASLTDVEKQTRARALLACTRPSLVHHTVSNAKVGQEGRGRLTDPSANSFDSRGLAMWDPRIQGSAHGRGSEPDDSPLQRPVQICTRVGRLPVSAFLKSSDSDDGEYVSRLAQEEWEVVSSLVGSNRPYSSTTLVTAIMPLVEADDHQKASRRGGRRSTTKSKMREGGRSSAQAGVESVTALGLQMK